MLANLAGLGAGVPANEIFILQIAPPAARDFYRATTGSCQSQGWAFGLLMSSVDRIAVCYGRSEKQKCCEDGHERESCFHHISPLTAARLIGTVPDNLATEDQTRIIGYPYTRLQRTRNP